MKPIKKTISISVTTTQDNTWLKEWIRILMAMRHPTPGTVFDGVKIEPRRVKL